MITSVTSGLPVRVTIQAEEDAGVAFDGITSLSVRPIRMVTGMGVIVSILGFIGIIWAVVVALMGKSIAGWASIVCIVCFLGGIQLLSLGIIGEYIGKTYMETKRRPRYIISERTEELICDKKA